MENKGIEHISEPLFYATMNMLHSDYGKVAKKYGLENNVDFWADMAYAWLYDDDANKNKTSLYYTKLNAPCQAKAAVRVEYRGRKTKNTPHKQDVCAVDDIISECPFCC